MRGRINLNQITIKNIATLPEIYFTERHIYKVLEYHYFISPDNSEGYGAGDEVGQVYLFNTVTNEVDCFTLWLNDYEEGEALSIYICLPTNEEDAEDLYEDYDIADLNLSYSVDKIVDGQIDSLTSIKVESDGRIFYFTSRENNTPNYLEHFYKPDNVKYGFNAYKFTLCEQPGPDNTFGQLYLSRLSHFYHFTSPYIKRDEQGELYVEQIGRAHV